MNKRKIRLYNIFGKGYHYETPMSNTDRIVAASLLVGLAGLSLGLQLGSNWGSEPSAQASEPVEAIKSVSVSTESVIVPVVDTEPVLVSVAVSEKEQIIAYIVEVFGEDAPDALKIAGCESGFNPEIIGDKHLMSYNNGELVGDSIGVYQVRTGASNWNRAKANGMTASEFRVYLKDFKNNIDYAKTIYDQRGWGAWHNCALKEL